MLFFLVLLLTAAASWIVAALQATSSAYRHANLKTAAASNLAGGHGHLLGYRGSVDAIPTLLENVAHLGPVQFGHYPNFAFAHTAALMMSGIPCVQ